MKSSEMTLGPSPSLPAAVLAHMSTGFMMLALSLSVILLLAMCLSLRPVFWCLNKVDLVFSSLSFITGKCWLGGRGVLPTPAHFPRAFFPALEGACQSFCPAVCWVSVFECLLGASAPVSLSASQFYFILLVEMTVWG